VKAKEELARRNFACELFDRLELKLELSLEEKQGIIKAHGRAIAELISRLNSATCELKELRERESVICKSITEYEKLLDASVRDREVAQTQCAGRQKRLVAEVEAKHIDSTAEADTRALPNGLEE